MRWRPMAAQNSFHVPPRFRMRNAAHRDRLGQATVISCRQDSR